MKISRSVIINAPIAVVWKVIRCFDAVSLWNPAVQTARMDAGAPTEVGSVRLLDIVDGTQFRETLLAHSDIEYYYTYNIIDSPLPCRDYIATHRLSKISDGDKTLSSWQGEFECEPADEDDLETIVGDTIYRDAQRALDQYIQALNS